MAHIVRHVISEDQQEPDRHRVENRAWDLDLAQGVLVLAKPASVSRDDDDIVVYGLSVRRLALFFAPGHSGWRPFDARRTKRPRWSLVRRVLRSASDPEPLSAPGPTMPPCLLDGALRSRHDDRGRRDGRRWRAARFVLGPCFFNEAGPVAPRGLDPTPRVELGVPPGRHHGGGGHPAERARRAGRRARRRVHLHPRPGSAVRRSFESDGGELVE